MADIGVGDVLVGRYEVIEELGAGKGGMGRVFLARERILDRLVAIKVMRSDIPADGVPRFQQELRLAARMQHPNIVTLFTSGVEDRIPFMVMEYIDGHDLTSKPVGWGIEEIVRVGRETFAALAYAHGLNVVHRDIKPGNLLTVNGTGRAKVADFGVAKALTASNANMPGTGIGTLPYMAPEQWRFKPATAAIDIWAAGCTLYEFLGGVVVGREVPLGALAAQGGRVPSLGKIARGVPSWLADAVMAMLEPDPASRPTAAECEQALTRPARPEPKRADGHTPTVRIDKDKSTVTIGPKITFEPDSAPLHGLPANSFIRGELAFSPDGGLLAVAIHAPEREIRFWDTATGHPTHRPIQTEGGASRLTFSPDGRNLVALIGHPQYKVTRWDVLTGRQARPMVSGAAHDVYDGLPRGTGLRTKSF